ncbi:MULTISPECIES: type I secretion system permease/ATPase [unclassified Rhizobium]|uniref:type I secretion system permease/ATPase n=1 Tax=unclassified Rhizobium TaxID=2613769 RepID=UPI001FDF34ED|nr:MULTISPECIES: type I secretion system permease/ATPase [Rhizobium]MDK4737538.1 type I secretion system permease/ATPase [Rhizobium sp. CNPSo 3464]UWU23272.1 type I secretion system permease/ATPase [Rhizobium tropici]
MAAIEDAVESLKRLRREPKAAVVPSPLSPQPSILDVTTVAAVETETVPAPAEFSVVTKVDEGAATSTTEIEMRLISPAPEVAPEPVIEPAPRLPEAEMPKPEMPRPEMPKPEMKVNQSQPLPRTIDNDSGPLRENERRSLAGGGGHGGNNESGKGGGGGGNDGGIFHKRSAQPINFAASLRKGISVVQRNMLIVMIFTLAINVLVLAIPIYLFQISDRVLTSRSIDTLVMLTIAVVGAILLQVIMDSVRRFILMRTAVELEVQLGAPILSAAARASLNGNGRDYQTLADLQLLRSFLTSGTLLAFLDAPLMPLFVVVVYLVHPHLGVIVMTCCAVLFVIAYLNQKMTAKQFAEANAFVTRANFHLDSMARNSQIINALAMIPEAVKMWGRETAGSLKSQVAAQDRNIVFSGLTKACRLITQVTLLGWGAHLSLSGQLTGGMVIAASIISGRALAPVEGAIEGWNQFNHSRAAYGRIKQLLLNSPLNFPRLRLPNPEGRLDVERILFVPPPQKRVVLNGISFSLKKGESLAVIGNSGSGKTTLGKMLVGSILPTSGNVRLDLMDLRNWDQRQFGESIGYLPQDVQLFPGTIKANICRMRDDVEDRLIYEAAVLADVHELIATFPQGYETVVAADGAPLSGGQKQRIALARAFFGNPKFVVLDEPNSNLDTAGEAALARALIHAKKQGITTVTITQRPALLQCVDKILVLKDGSVALFGERTEVLKTLSNKPSNEIGNRPPARIEG